MPWFQYTALTRSGEQISGRIEAESHAAALAQVQRQNIIPIDVKGASKTPWWALNVDDFFKTAGSAKSLCFLFKQLARLLKAGLELSRALQLLTELEENKAWQQIIRRMDEGVRRGKSLSETMADEGRMFPGDYVNMVRAGEATGMLGAALERAASLLQRRIEITQRVLSALIYPAILLATAVGAIVVILTAVLPQFEPLFTEAHVTMPWPTRVVVALSHAVQNYWWIGAIVFFAALLLWRVVKRSSSLLLSRDRLMLRAPLVGELLLRADITRLTRTLGTLIQNGTTLGAGLSIAGEGVKNMYLRAAIDSSVLAIREGEGLANPLMKTGCFPKLMVNMLQIGEETGRLEEMLIEVADIYEEEMQRSIDRMLTLLVPSLTIVMGLVVAFLVASMLMAMSSVNDLPL